MSHLRFYMFDPAGKLLGPRRSKLSTALMPGAELPGTHVTAAEALAVGDKCAVVNQVLVTQLSRGYAVGAVGLVRCLSGDGAVPRSYEATFAAVGPNNAISSAHAATFDELDMAVRYMKLRVRQIIRARAPRKTRERSSGAGKKTQCQP